MAIVTPRIAKTEERRLPTVVIGTVRGDLHDIGKNLVAALLEGAGFDVVDVGVDVPPQKFVTTAREKGARLIGLSALLTTTMMAMKEVLQALQEAGLRDQVRVIVGGAAVSRPFADEIGADGYATDAADAVQVSKQLLGLA